MLRDHAREVVLGATADTVGLFTGVVVVTALVLVLDAGLARLQARSPAWRPVASDVGV